MSKAELIIGSILTVTEELSKSKGVQKFLCGEYSNGKPRSLIDALDGEIYSPSQKKRCKKKKKKKGKNKNHNKKKKKIYFDI